MGVGTVTLSLKPVLEHPAYLRLWVTQISPAQVGADRLHRLLIVEISPRFGDFGRLDQPGRDQALEQLPGDSGPLHEIPGFHEVCF